MVGMGALALGAATAPARGQGTMTIAVDVDTKGNGPLTVDTIDTCNDTMQTAGDTLTIDVIVDEINTNDRLLAWSFNLEYDPSVVEIIDANRDMMIKALPDSGANGGFVEIGDENPTPARPDKDGLLVQLISDFGTLSPATTHEAGKGVLLRVELRATGTGQSALTIVGTIQNPISIVAPPGPGRQLVTALTKIGSARVAVGQDCSSPPPSPSAKTTPTPVANPDKDPDGDGLSNADEQRLGTDPKKPDTDGDGISDGQEVNVLKTDPLVAGSELITPSAQPTGGDANQTDQPGDDGDSGLSTGAWIAIGLASGAVLAALGLGGWLARRRMGSS